MRYGSVCSGIEAATVAWEPLGWKAAWYSEIEPFPSAVLKHHYSNTPNLGDMTKFKEWPDGTIDVLVGGTPCQSFSVAGLRKGLDDPRGNLMLTFGAIAGKYRPRWLVWENVPGVLSSANGRDFASFLGLITGQRVTPPAEGWSNSGVLSGYKNAYGVAWRILDAQFAGVPQRRRRVFVVGYLGDWRPAAAVLFERHSLQGHPAPSREKGERIAPTVASGPPFSRTGNERVECDAMVVSPLMSGSGHKAGHGARSGHCKDSHIVPVICMETGQASAGIGIGTTLNCNHEAPIVAHSLRGEGFDASEDGTGRGIPLVPVRERECVCRMREGKEGTHEADASSILSVLRKKVGKTTLAEWGSRILDSLQSPEVLQSWLHGGSIRDSSEDFKSWVDDRPLSCEKIYAGEQLRTVWENGPDGRTSQGRGLAKQLAYELGKALPELPHERASQRSVSHQVRRLTPVECEFLQGFSRGYTLIPWRGKPKDQCPDGPRYKSLGNSMAVPVMSWIGTRIQMVEDLRQA